MKNLKEILIDQLSDLYSAEEQLVKALPIASKAATEDKLKEAISNHLKETKNQVDRLKEIGSMLGAKLTGKTCQAMKGLIKEADEIMEESYGKKELKDAMIVSIAQKIEHYEIAGYGNAVAIASYLGLDEVAEKLQETLSEEEEADELLTDVCQAYVFPNSEEDEKPSPSHSRKDDNRGMSKH